MGSDVFLNPHHVIIILEHRVNVVILKEQIKPKYVGERMHR